MVRDAIISLENGPVLAVWAPGYQAIDAPNGTAFKLPAGAKLTMKIHYKKNWNDEQNVKGDRSTIGLYMTDAPLSGRSIDSVSLAYGEGNGGGERKFSTDAEIGRTDRRPASQLRSALRIGQHRRRRAVRPARPAAASPGAAAAVVPPLLAAGADRDPRGVEARGDGRPRAAGRIRHPGAEAVPAGRGHRLRRAVAPGARLVKRRSYGCASLLPCPAPG